MVNKKRPLYDPTIEQLNDKAREAASNRSKEKSERIVSHEAQSLEGRAAGITEHAKRIQPEGTKHVGSLCIHVYEKRGALTSQHQMLSLNAGRLTAPLMQEALKSLTLHAMKQVGIKPPKTLNAKKQLENTIEKNL